MKRAINTLAITAGILLAFVSCKEDMIQPELFGSIEGVVLDAESGEVIAAASVQTTPATEAILTDEDGTFRLVMLPVGAYTLQVSRNGYKKETVNVTVRDDQISNASILLNTLPTETTLPPPPVTPLPPDRAEGLQTAVTLSWSGGMKDTADSLRYDVKLYEASITTPFVTHAGLADTVVELSGLRFNTVYYWQVTTRDIHGQETRGELWSFRTRGIPDAPFLYSSLVDGTEQIFRSDSTMLNTLQLTSSPSRDRWPRWNKWKTKIAFISDRDGAYHIYTMLPDGSQQTRITSIPIAGYHNHGRGFSWTPDAGWLFYPHYDKIYRVDQHGANQWPIATAPQNRHFREIDWSPLYDRMVVLTIGVNSFDSELYLMNSTGGDVELLLDNSPGALGSPSFSIDGKNVMFTRDISGFQSGEGRQLDARIFLLDLQTRDTTMISVDKPDGSNDLYPRFSPDGAWVVFINSPNDNPSSGDLYIMRRNGRERTRIAQNVTTCDWK